MWPALLLIGGGIAALLAYYSSDVADAASTIVDEVKQNVLNLFMPSAALPLLPVIFQVAQEEGVSPFLIAAIIKRESGFGAYLTPPTYAGTGDYGHGHGLMQIDDRSWGQWLAANDWGDPLTNIRKGTRILKEDIQTLRNNFPAMPEDSILRAAISAYNTGTGNVLNSIRVGRDTDATTTGKNYAADTLATAKSWEDLYTSLT